MYICTDESSIQDMKKGLIKLIVAVVAVFLLVRLCSQTFGNVITLPGGLGGESSGDSGGWFSPKGQNDGSTTGGNVDIDIKDLERDLGVGGSQGSSSSDIILDIPSANTTPSSTPSATASAPLSFKGIPISGTLSAFGSELVKGGFRSAGNGTYTGDFAGYSGCKVTPSGSNPVREVRVDFPVIQDWDALEKAYDSLQASLTQKYGMEPSVSGNIATYRLPGGTITLDADVKDRSTWHVILTYANTLSAASTGSQGRNPIDDL